MSHEKVRIKRKKRKKKSRQKYLWRIENFSFVSSQMTLKRFVDIEMLSLFLQTNNLKIDQTFRNWFCVPPWISLVEVDKRDFWSRKHDFNLIFLFYSLSCLTLFVKYLEEMSSLNWSDWFNWVGFWFLATGKTQRKSTDNLIISWFNAILWTKLLINEI